MNPNIIPAIKSLYADKLDDTLDTAIASLEVVIKDSNDVTIDVFQENNIEDGSLRISQSFMNKSIDLSGCQASSMSVTVHINLDVDTSEAYNYKGKTISVSIQNETQRWEYPNNKISLFVGIIDSADIDFVNATVSITAYDILYTLSEKDFSDWYNLRKQTTVGALFSDFMSAISSMYPFFPNSLRSDSVMPANSDIASIRCCGEAILVKELTYNLPGISDVYVKYSITPGLKLEYTIQNVTTSGTEQQTETTEYSVNVTNGTGKKVYTPASGEKVETDYQNLNIVETITPDNNNFGVLEFAYSVSHNGTLLFTCDTKESTTISGGQTKYFNISYSGNYLSQGTTATDILKMFCQALLAPGFVDGSGQLVLLSIKNASSEPTLTHDIHSYEGINIQSFSKVHPMNQVIIRNSSDDDGGKCPQDVDYRKPGKENIYIIEGNLFLINAPSKYDLSVSRFNKINSILTNNSSAFVNSFIVNNASYRPEIEPGDTILVNSPYNVQEYFYGIICGRDLTIENSHVTNNYNCTIELEYSWFSNSPSGTNIAGKDSGTYLPSGEYGKQSKPLRAVSVREIPTNWEENTIYFLRKKESG